MTEKIRLLSQAISGPAENVNARRLASERRIKKAPHEEVNKDIKKLNGWSIIQFPLDH